LRPLAGVDEPPLGLAKTPVTPGGEAGRASGFAGRMRPLIDPGPNHPSIRRAIDLRTQRQAIDSPPVSLSKEKTLR